MGAGCFTRENGSGREVEKYKCRLATQGIWQVEGGAVHGGVLTHPSDSVNPNILATVAAKDGELRQFDAEQKCLEANVHEETYIKILEENQKFPGAVGLLNKIYRLVQADNCWFNKFRNDCTAIRFEQSDVDPCAFR